MTYYVDFIALAMELGRHGIVLWGRHVRDRRILWASQAVVVVVMGRERLQKSLCDLPKTLLHAYSRLRFQKESEELRWHHFV